MTWHAAEMPDDALPPDSLVGRLLNPEPECDDVPPVFPEDGSTLPVLTEEVLAASERAGLPLCLWQILAPVLDDYICEALRASDDPDAVQEPEYPACRQEVFDVIEAVRDYIAPESEPPSGADWPDAYYRMRCAKWERDQEIRALLTEQARIAREQQS